MAGSDMGDEPGEGGEFGHEAHDAEHHAEHQGGEWASDAAHKAADAVHGAGAAGVAAVTGLGAAAAGAFGKLTGHHEEHAAEAAHSEELDLEHHEDRLPWLESSDAGEDYADEYERGDSRRMIGFVAMGLMALAAIVGGIWWATHRGPDPALVADGSTIAASDQPYKEAPKNPGGKTFDGTGDSSFAVSEGQNKTAHLGNGAAAGGHVAAGAGEAAAGAHAGAGEHAAANAGPAAPAGGTAVQVGAFSSQAGAETGWSTLVGRSGALGAVAHRVVAGDADIGKVYRLQAIAADESAAEALCGKLKGEGISCQVK